MPLPALPLNSTNRLFVDYVDGYNEHTLIVRTADVLSPGSAIAVVKSVLDILQPQLYQTFAVQGCRFQEAGSIITLPVPPDDLEGFVGTGPELMPAQRRPLQWNFMGRGVATGRQVKWGLFGLATALPDSYRYQGSGITAAFSSVLSELSSIGGDAFITIGGDEASWKAYVNVQYNSYYETKARG